MTVYELVIKFEAFAANTGARVTIDVENSDDLFFMGGINRFLDDPYLLEKYGSFEITSWHVNTYGSLRIFAQC